MFEFTFKDIPENGSFAGKTIVLPTPSGDEQTIIDLGGRKLTDQELEKNMLPEADNSGSTGSATGEASAAGEASSSPNGKGTGKGGKGKGGKGKGDLIEVNDLINQLPASSALFENNFNCICNITDLCGKVNTNHENI